MSYLDLPRIHFLGEMFTNVTTGNNDDVHKADKFVDVARVAVNVPDGMTNADFRRWLMQLDPTTKKIRAGWNYFGDARCWFKDVTITGVQKRGDHEPVTNPDDDPLIGAKVSLKKAIMVDVDPESILSSQIFCDELQIKVGDRLLCQGRPTPIYSRWHYSFRNLAFLGKKHFARASAVWQAAIPRHVLRIQEANYSPTLEALHTAAQAGQGLCLRFCTYYFKHDLLHEELAERFNRGFDQGFDLNEVVNPAHGWVVGTIGPWYDGEMASATTGRLLFDYNSLFHHGEPYLLGPAMTQVDSERDVIVLDLITTFPEQDETRAKIQKGTISLQLEYKKDDQTHYERLGPVPYDRATYESGGGIVEINYPPELAQPLAEGTLWLVRDESGLKPLKEVDLAVETDERGIYLQEQGQTKTVEVRVFKKGQLAQDAVEIKLEQYVMTDFDRGGGPPLPSIPASPDQYIVDMSLTAVDRGLAQLTLTPKKPGTCIIRFVPAAQPGWHFDKTFTTSFFISVRVFPADNYDEVPDSALTFDFIYREVLRYFDLLYPGLSALAMNRRYHHPNSNDENNMREYALETKARLEKDMTDPDYMPRTRDLSEGKRKLLLRWCEWVSRADSPFET